MRYHIQSCVLAFKILVFVALCCVEDCQPLAIITERRRSRLLPWAGKTSFSNNNNNNNQNIGWALEERGPHPGSLTVTLGWGDNDDSSSTAAAATTVQQQQLPTVSNTDSLASSTTLLASTLWPAGLAAGILACSPQCRAFLRNKSVLELGCGLGLAGLVAAEAAASCHLTDNDATVIGLLQEQLGINKKSKQNSSPPTNIQASLLDWRDCDQSCTSISTPVDVVLGSDIAYYYYLLRYLMDTARAFLKPSSTFLVVGQANRESQWELYRNLLNGCYNQLTDEHEAPWPGTTQMLLYKLELSKWYETTSESKNSDATVEIDGVIPIAVLLHQTSPEVDALQLTWYDHVATAEDEEKMMMTF